MFGSINFTAQNRLGTFNCQRSNLFTQNFACTIHFLLRIGFSLCCNPHRLDRSLFFRFFYDFGGTFFGVSYHFGNLVTPFSQEFCNFLLCLFKIALTALGSSQAFGNFCGTLI